MQQGRFADAAGGANLVRSAADDPGRRPAPHHSRRDPGGLRAPDAETSFRLQARPGRSLETCPWKIENGELRVTLPIILRLSGKYHCEGAATVATRDPKLLSWIQNGGTGTVNPDHRSWRLVGIDLSIGIDLDQVPPGILSDVPPN